MIHKNINVVVLAAGLGTRMKSALVKVLHPVGGQPMIIYPLKVAEKLDPKRILVVVGLQADRIKATCLEFLNSSIIPSPQPSPHRSEGEAGNSQIILSPPSSGERVRACPVLDTGLRGIKRKFLDDQAKPTVEFVVQGEPLGTGHALMQVEPSLAGSGGDILVLCGDVPLLGEQTLRLLLDRHIKRGAAMSLLTAEVPDPIGYGRIIRDGNGSILKIVEDKDASPQEKQIKEVNTGIYCFQADFLFKALKGISCRNRQGEYYLTDALEVGQQGGYKIEVLLADEADEVVGINNRKDLAKAEAIIRYRTAERMMLDGVTILHPESTFIDATVEIGRDTVVFPDTYLQGQTKIGERCRILPGTQIKDSILEDEVEVLGYSVITQSHLKQGVKVGPFAHLRPETILEERAKIGNFVEVKKSIIGSESKANHLSYIGDATVGKRVNVGAGTITCNYDGKKKHPTYIEDDVFIGSDTQFVAPVRIGKGSLIGAGTTVTKDVPAYSLAISRVKQQNLLRRSRAEKKEAENSPETASSHTEENPER